MKNKVIAFVLGLACMGALLSCGEPSAPAASSSSPAESSNISEPEISLGGNTYTDVETIDVPSGEYMVTDTIYAFDKDNKKISVTKYEDYDSYKNKQGTVLYDGAVRFVKVSSTFAADYNAVYFEIEKVIYLLHYNASNKITLSSINGTITFSSGCVLVSEVPLFVNGNYVSEKQTQNKVKEDGTYAYDEAGNLIKEEIYLFLELSDTKASIFLGDNASTHAETALHSVENYKTRFVSGKLQIKIPHKDGEFDCTLTSYTENEIKFINSMERKGDYSCSGTFTKMA